MRIGTPFVAALTLCTASAAQADCATDEEIAAFVTSFNEGTPAVALGAQGDMDDALCTQGKLAEAMEPVMGPVIGYKAGLTSKPAQDRFGVSAPLRGLLFRDMMLADGTNVPEAFGTIPLFEADLILVVGDEGINGATTAEEVMAHVSAIRPFIELPDLMLAEDQPMTGETITAMAVGARMGIIGAEIPVDDPAAMTEALGAMNVTMTAADGTILVDAPGTDVLGNPANAVLFLSEAGVTFAAGDLVSVGSFGPLFPPTKAGGQATVRYTGLPGDPVISVRFAR